MAVMSFVSTGDLLTFSTLKIFLLVAVFALDTSQAEYIFKKQEGTLHQEFVKSSV